MAHARLYFGEHELVVPTPDGPPLRLRTRQIHAWVQFGRDNTLHQTVVDTGSPVCTLPRRFWDKLDDRDDMIWVANPPATVPADQLTNTTTLLGGQYRFRVGRVRVRINDMGDGQLAAREVLAFCLEDGGSGEVPLILGLAEILNGRALLLQVSDGGARWAGVINEP